MLERIYDLYDDLSKDRVMLFFKGELDDKMVGVLLGMVERKMEAFEPSHRTRKRVFHVLTECLQNLYHHGKDKPDFTIENDGIVVVSKKPEGYSVFTGNYMSNGDVESLKNQLDRINGLDAEELKQFYREVLGNGQYSEKGGGGLGMIDMARKSKKKLEYAFVPVDGENAFFSLNVNVTEEK